MQSDSEVRSSDAMAQASMSDGIMPGVPKSSMLTALYIGDSIANNCDFGKI